MSDEVKPHLKFSDHDGHDVVFRDRDGKHLWDIQTEYLDKFYGPGKWPTEEELPSVTKDYLIHLMKEATEVLDEVPWKMHRGSQNADIDFDNLLEELVDTQKFLWGLMQVLGYTWDQFREEFKRKSMVVEQRLAQERSLPKLISHPVMIIDIDGVITDYPKCFEDWCRHNFFGHISEHDMGKLLREMDPVNRADLKHKYRRSGAKAHLPVLPGAVELLQYLRAKSKAKIILLTNRPYHKYYRIYPDTLEFLKKRQIPYDGIIWGQDKGVDALRKFKNICFAVEDSQDNVEKYRDAKITTIHLAPGIPGRDTMALYQLALKTEKIEDLGYAWNRGER